MSEERELDREEMLAGVGGRVGGVKEDTQRRSEQMSMDGIKDFLCLQRSYDTHGGEKRLSEPPDNDRSRKSVARSYSPQKSRPLLVPMSRSERRAKLAIRAIAIAAQQEEGEQRGATAEAGRMPGMADANEFSAIDSLSEMAFSFDTDEQESLARSVSGASSCCCCRERRSSEEG